ncbi:MAG: type II secretion system F family protein [Candidatus Micrarchaeota archaeon]
MVQEKGKNERSEFIEGALANIASRFPNLKRDLVLAGMGDGPKDFVLKGLLIAIAVLLLFIVLSVVGSTVSQSWIVSPAMTATSAPAVFILAFLFAMRIPEALMLRRRRHIDSDIVFAGRQILIELKAGIPLFDALLGASEGYGEVSGELSKVVEKTSVGISLDVAMREVAEKNPSKAFGRIMSQLASSVRSGSNVAPSFESVLEQVAREQEIELKAYGQKLNPLAMFYMIIGVILPSLGVVLMIIVLSFINVRIGADVLVAFLVAQALLQYIFFTMVDSARPRLYA